MKWCSGLALALVLAISATANAQGNGALSYRAYGNGGSSASSAGASSRSYGSQGYASQGYASQASTSRASASRVNGSGLRAMTSGYRYQDAEPVAPAEGVPAPAPAVRKSVPYEGHAAPGPDVVYDDGYAGGCDSCGSRGLCCRKPLLPLFSSCCARPVSCGCAVDSCCEPSCCSPTLLQRLHCQCQARWSNMTCRVRTFHQNLWGTGCCSTCGETNLWGGSCGCSKGAEVWQDQGRDPLMPQAVPQPAPHDAPGPVPETDVPGKTTRRYVPSTVVPSAAWKWTPIRSSY